MLSHLLRRFALALAVFVIFLLSPARDVLAVCCHCYFDQRPAAERTQCIRIPEIASCDQNALDTYIRTVPELRALLSGRSDLNTIHCDRSPVADALCVAGTGARTDRCPSRPPITMGQLAEVYPRDGASPSATPPAPAPAPTPAPSGDQPTEEPTTPASGSSGASTNRTRQARAREYNRTFPNPLPGLTLQKAIGGVIRMLVGLVGIFFLVVFIWGSFLYMTAAGDPKDIEKGKEAIKNAVIGLVIVMFAYTAVSLIIDTAGNLMGTTTTPTISQESGGEVASNQTNNNSTRSGGAPGLFQCGCTCTDTSMSFEPESATCDNATCGTACARSCGTHGGVQTASCQAVDAPRTDEVSAGMQQCGCSCGDSSMTFMPEATSCDAISCRSSCTTACARNGGLTEAFCSGPEAPGAGASAGTALAACTAWYSGPPATCFERGAGCPAGANTVDDLLRIWSSRLPAQTPAAASACRSCIEENIARIGRDRRYGGLDMTCMPAIVGSWVGDCSGSCSGTTRDAEIDTCASSSYIDDRACGECITRAADTLNTRRTSEEAQNILRERCDGERGKILNWCLHGHPGWSQRGAVCRLR